MRPSKILEALRKLPFEFLPDDDLRLPPSYRVTDRRAEGSQATEVIAFRFLIRKSHAEVFDAAIKNPYFGFRMELTDESANVEGIAISGDAGKRFLNIKFIALGYSSTACVGYISKRKHELSTGV